jgi:hypothetical protein
MKKTLLSAAFIVSAYFSANAQQNISFETTEGYTTGALNNQSGWIVEDYDEGGPGTTAVIISSERHTAGSRSVKFVADQEDNNIDYDAYKLFTPAGTIFTVTQDVYVDGLDVENGSDLNVFTGYLQNNTATLTSLLYFSFQGTIEVMTGYDTFEDEPIVTEVGTFQQGNWYEVKTIFNTTAGTVAYYLNNQLLRTANFTPGFQVNTLGYTFGAYTTSFFVDDITITSGTAGTEQQLASQFTVSPNPATGLINISNNTNALVNKVAVTDLNGRTVTTAEFAGVASAQVDIANLASGVYMLTISSDMGTTTKKIVKN